MEDDQLVKKTDQKTLSVIAEADNGQRLSLLPKFYLISFVMEVGNMHILKAADCE